MSTDSLFTTCSTTKAFTAAAVSLAIDDSKTTDSPLHWDTPISSLIRDDFVLVDSHATANTTLEDALSHRTGLPGHETAMALAYPSETLREAMQRLRHLPLAYAPRTTFDYCNHMYMAVSHALEQMAGEGLGAILKGRIWSPLDMQDTYFSVKEVKDCPSTRSRLVQGYTWVPEMNEYAAEAHMDYAPTTGTGAIVSNVLDYTKWLRALVYQTGPISPEGYAELLRPRTIISNWDHLVVPPSPVHLYALGWFMDNYRGEQLYWHSGSWPGFGIMVGFIPSRQFGFVMMGNAVNARNAQLELYLYLIDKLLGVPGAQRTEHIAKMTQRVKEKEKTNSESMEEAKKRLYPSLPEHPISHLLPLDRYAGIYRHAGYGSIPLTLKGGQLHSNLTDRVIRMHLTLAHASGAFFVARAYPPGRRRSGSEYFRVEFHIDSSGTPQKLGMELERGLGGEKIWFIRT